MTALESLDHGPRPVRPEPLAASEVLPARRRGGLRQTVGPATSDAERPMVAVLTARGDIDVEEIGLLRAGARSSLAALRTARSGAVVVDLTGTRRLAPAAFAVLVSCAWDVRAVLGRPLHLVVDAARPVVLPSYLTGLGELLTLSAAGRGAIGEVRPPAVTV